VVAAASGAVGSVVGQIAKIRGTRAVGIAGGADKCRYVTEELGFDACIDHRSADFAAQLKSACPEGIDVYFENVRGKVFEAVVPLLNNNARVPVCGVISHYNAVSPDPGVNWVPTLMRTILTKRLTVRGFLVGDFFPRYREFTQEMTPWVREGRVKYREHVIDGLENAPRGLIGLLRGENFGKTLVRL
jgi:NADPH-dependent curcumin reductase CurA